ncbi:MAG: P-loop NTPase family protein [Leptolyngbya sp. SIOISBB]|nr:P-loop NTPase family protein [Leptolyngbya sp. SIOISBB]
MVSQLRVPLIHAASEQPSRVKEHPWLHAIAGTVQVFTSPHRTFFTNVMVQAMRVAGQGHAVLITQFLKGGIRQGIDQPMLFGQGLQWLRPDIQRSLQKPDATEAEQAAITQLWHHTEAAVMQGRYSLVVLDELSLAIQLGLISEAAVLAFLQQRPSQVDVILTGPDMPDSLLEVADQVTEFRRHFIP